MECNVSSEEGTPPDLGRALIKRATHNRHQLNRKSDYINLLVRRMRERLELCFSFFFMPDMTGVWHIQEDEN